MAVAHIDGRSSRYAVLNRHLEFKIMAVVGPKVNSFKKLTEGLPMPVIELRHS